MTTETHRERELKLCLPDEETWAAARNALGDPARTLRQVNTYFDTRRRTLRGMMVRVREEDGALAVTAKDRAVIDPETSSLSSRERTAPLLPAQWALVHRGRCALTALPIPLCEALRVEAGDALFPIGSVVNTRTVHPLAQGYLAELDRTELPGGRVDYEVEVELRESGHTLIGALVALAEALPGLDVRSWEAASPKYARFLDCLLSPSR